MLDADVLEPLLRNAWNRQTCDPAAADAWRPDNPARGQCGVTALVLQDVLGGDLMFGEVFDARGKVGHHYWNRLPDGRVIDLTADQFYPGERVVGGAVRHRPPDTPHRCREQYALLRERFYAALPIDLAVADLTRLVCSSPWLMGVLATVRDDGPATAWVGGGVVRDLVWGSRYGSGFTAAGVRDVDVAFFDPADLSRAHDDRVTARLAERAPHVPWEAKNQAAVHTWYAAKFGGEPVAALTSLRDAVATWPETATSVAVRLDADGGLEVCAPCGLADLLGGVWRVNPTRITPQRSRERLARHRPAERFPTVRVIPPD